MNGYVRSLAGQKVAQRLDYVWSHHLVDNAIGRVSSKQDRSTLQTPGLSHPTDRLGSKTMDEMTTSCLGAEKHHHVHSFRPLHLASVSLIIN